MKLSLGRIRRWVCAIACACGGTIFALSGCDTDASTSILSGLETMTISLVDVFFTEVAEQISADSATSTTTTTDTSGT